ncbi:unnamed protein product, partial [Symbiodinium sp. CCMP2456]
MQNYESAELSAEQLEAHFRADEAKGLMICTTEAEAKRQYGEHSVLIAAMGAIMKPNGDIRPLHDGTHGIGLNNRIRIQDALHFKGGITVDFIGYHIAYQGWAAGISERRAGWIIGWIDDCEAGGWMIAGRRLTEFTGRLNFVARLLLWIRPFLAPLFSFQAVLNRGTVARAPTMVCIALTFLRSELKKGSRLESVLQPWPDPRQAFRTDAKCETGRVVLAGWSLKKGLKPSDAAWFAVEILPSQLPWLFKEDGSSQWASTTAELLASYAALHAFGHLATNGRRDNLRLVVNAGTDNRSTPAIQQKGLSNKWPVQAVHMQMVSRLHACHKICRLQWRPREENVEADDLTNFKFEKFSLANRIIVEL